MNLSEEFITKSKRQIQISAILTGLAIKNVSLYMLHKLRKSDPKLLKGKVSLQKLSARTRSIKTLDITEQSKKAFEKLCKKYGVMYNIQQDKDATTYTILYREEDVERVQKALSNMAKDAEKEIEVAKDDIVKTEPITKEQIENIQNKFENILEEVTEKEASFDVIVDNSIDGISDLAKIKKHAQDKEPLKVQIEKAKEIKAIKPKAIKPKAIQTEKMLGGR